MGKKSKNKSKILSRQGRHQQQPAAAAAAEDDDDLAARLASVGLAVDTEARSPPHVTIEQAKELPMSLNHIWRVAIVNTRHGPSLIVMDVTPQFLQDTAADKAYADLAILVHPPLDNATAITQMILNAMVNPNPPGPGESSEFYRPRRPQFLLLDPKLQPVFAEIKSQIELLCVPVRLVSNFSCHEAQAYVQKASFKVDEGKTFYEPGRERPTAAIVRSLPQNVAETWKIKVYLETAKPFLEGDALIMVENHTDPVNPSMVWNGCAKMANFAYGILTAMTCPVNDTPHRPGRIVLDPNLTPLIKGIKQALLGSGVEVVKHTVFEQSNAAQCFNPSCCGVANSSTSEAKIEPLWCPCREVAYCCKACQKIHWEKEHKRRCSWHSEKKRSAVEEQMSAVREKK